MWTDLHEGAKRLFEAPQTFGVIFSSLAVGLAIGLAQGLMQSQSGAPAFFRTLALAMAVALLVGLGIRDYVASETLRLCLIGAATVIADDIWAGIRAIGRLFREDPLGAMGRLIDALRGKSNNDGSR